MILSLAVVRALFSLMRVARLMLERLVVPLKVIRVRARSSCDSVQLPLVHSLEKRVMKQRVFRS